MPTIITNTTNKLSKTWLAVVSMPNTFCSPL